MEQKKCKNCGKEITTEGRTLFCSADCQSVFYNKNRKTKIINPSFNNIKKTCKCCGKEFDTIRPHQIFCSKECQRKHLSTMRAKYVNEGDIIKICKYCGKEFNTNNIKQLYCSDRCNKRYSRSKSKHLPTMRAKYVNEGDIIKICKYCGKEFNTNNIKQLYCSNSCNKRYSARSIYLKNKLNKNI